MVAAGIDIGTNTILMVVAEVDQRGHISVLQDLHHIPRLGEGFKERGTISDEAMRRAMEVLASFRTILANYGNPPVTAVATEALRAAKNGDKVRKHLEHALGSPIHVISGQQEAVLMFAGTTAGVFGPTTVIDIGGGSTELVVGMEGRATWAQSLPLGCVTLTEQYSNVRPVLPLARALLVSHIDEAFYALQVPKQLFSSSQLLAVAGTATAMAVLDAGLPSFSAERIDGYVLDMDRVGYWSGVLLDLDLEQLHTLQGVDSRRVDILPAGVTILHRLMQLLEIKSVKISVKGLRYGALLHTLNFV